MKVHGILGTLFAPESCSNIIEYLLQHKFFSQLSADYILWRFALVRNPKAGWTPYQLYYFQGKYLSYMNKVVYRTFIIFFLLFFPLLLWFKLYILWPKLRKIATYGVGTCHCFHLIFTCKDLLATLICYIAWHWMDN